MFKPTDNATNYVVAEFDAVKKKRRSEIDPIASQFEYTRNQTGEYMRIDEIHGKN